MKTLLIAIVLSLASTAMFAQIGAKPVAKKPRHAIVRLVMAPKAAVPAVKFFSKATLKTIMFTTEIGVDGVHGGLFTADKAFEAISLKGKFPILDSIYSFVDVADKDTGKLDSWLERQEMGLFGSSN